MASESPAGARRRLRLVLRALRDRSGLTQQQVADELDWSLSKVNRIENGEVTLSVSDLHAALDLYKMERDQQRTDLVALARAARKRDTSFDGFAPDALTPAMVKLVQFEREAIAIRTFFPAIVDGLLQTPAYAAAILDYVHGRDTDPGRHDARVEYRLHRQREVLQRSEPPRISCLLDESVLYRVVGGARTMTDQLAHLLDLTERDAVDVRVIPMTAGAMLALMPAFIVVELPGEENALLYRESYSTDVVVEDDATVAQYRRRFEEAWELALGEAASRRLIDARRAELLSALDRSQAGG